MTVLELTPRAEIDSRHTAFSGSARRGKMYTRAVCAALGIGSVLAFAVHYWPRELDVSIPKSAQAISHTGGQVGVYVPGRALVGELSRFDDGLFAYLMFDYYRGRGLLRDSQLMLVSREGDSPVFRIVVHLPSDLIAGVTRLAELKADGLTSDIQCKWITHSELVRYQQQTLLALETYEQPATHDLAHLHKSELRAYLRRFIRFKSVTDARIHTGGNGVSSPLSPTQASLLAADIIAVSEFYEIPIELMLGIGAMENNYMNVRGDLENTAWKRRPQPGDIVLWRERSRLLVCNDSVGVWQITRESLRYAHALYLKDKRDYSLLPERLRPERTLDLNNIDPQVLTTYAGLLLRDLLDRFNGDVIQAAGAYNGTVAHPNLHYAAGVQLVADYARKVIERAADLNRSATAATSVEQSTLAEIRQ
jgi:hypothetical protein